MFASVIAHLHTEPVASLPRSVLADRVETVRALRGALDAYEARLVAAVDALGDHGLDGAGMLRSAGRVSARRAVLSAKRAEGLRMLPATRDALAGGRITAEHVDAIVEAAEKVTPEKADAELVERATRAPADRFTNDSREWATRNRDDDGADEAAVQRLNRQARTWIQRRGDKMFGFYAELDRIDGAAAHAALDRRYNELWNDDGGRDGGADDVRTVEQRMADAFVSLITGTRADESGDDPPRPPHPKHQLNVIHDIAGHTTADGTPLAWLVTDGQPLPEAVLERIACTATITPMIFTGPATPIWQGRAHRHATIAQWRSLIARDRGCIGCGAAPNRCEAHHVIPWEHHGPTDIDNLVLVCSRCHHDIHDRGSTIERIDGHWAITARAGPTSPTNGPGADDHHQLALGA